jgi:hypothetical protein
MESNQSSDERWQNVVALQRELDESMVTLPRLVSRRDGSTRDASPRTVRFAEALAFTDRWSGITDARRRRFDDLAA